VVCTRSPRSLATPSAVTRVPFYEMHAQAAGTTCLSVGFHPCLVSSGEVLDPEDAEARVKCFLMELELSESDRHEARACLSHCDWNLQEAVPAARAIEDKIRDLREAKKGGWMTWEEYYGEYVHELSERHKSERSFADAEALRDAGSADDTANPSSAPTTTLIEEVGAEEVSNVDSEESAADAPRSGACDQHVKQVQAVMTLQCATRCWLSRRAFENSFADLFARAANVSAAAAHASEAQGGTRKLSFDATAALLEALALDGSIVTFIAYNDFGYKGRYAVPKAEREYWLKISRDKLPTSLREKYPGLLVADDLVIMHVHYEGDHPWPGNPSRPKVPLNPHRMVITQINVRHTWQGGGPLSSYPCEDPGGELHGMIKESSGEPVLVANPGWNWKDSRAKGKKFTFPVWIGRPRRLESRVLEPKHTASLQDLLVKGEMYADHGGRKVRKKFFGLAQSPSDDGSEAAASSSAKDVAKWEEPDWSKFETPAAMGSLKILFVGVNCNEKVDLNLKQEHQVIQGALDCDRTVFKGSSDKPTMIQTPYSNWDEVLTAIEREHPTWVQFGCHSHKGGIELFGERMKPEQMKIGIETWNANQQRLGKPHIRVIVVNACQSDMHAQTLSPCVDFSIGHAGDVFDEHAISFSKRLHGSFFTGMSLRDSFNMAISGGSLGYRMYAKKNPEKFRLENVGKTSIATPGADKDGTSAAARGAVESDAGTGCGCSPKGLQEQLAGFDSGLRSRLCCPEFGFGLQWRKIGVEKPQKGSKLKHEALAETLKRSTEFTQKDFAIFHVSSLSFSSYIKVGDTYFQPIAPPGFEEVLLTMLNFLAEEGVRSKEDLCDAVFEDIFPDCTVDRWPLKQLDKKKFKNLRNSIMEEEKRKRGLRTLELGMESIQVQPKAVVNESSRPIEGVVSATIPNAGTVSNDDFASAESDIVLDSTTSMDVSMGIAHAEEAIVTDPSSSPQDDVSSPEHAGIYIFMCSARVLCALAVETTSRR